MQALIDYVVKVTTVPQIQLDRPSEYCETHPNDSHAARLVREDIRKLKFRNPEVRFMVAVEREFEMTQVARFVL